MSSTTPSTIHRVQPSADGRRADGHTRSQRLALDLDSGVTIPFGMASALGSGGLAGQLGIPRAWLLGLGVFMVIYGVDLYLARRLVVDARRPWARTLVRSVAVSNAIWVVASLAVVVLGVWEMTVIGVVVLLQAAIVEGFAVVQWRASRAT